MKLILSFLILVLLATSVPAQITFTSDDFIAHRFGLNFPDGRMITFESQDTTGLQSLVNQVGSKQTWDIGGRVYTVHGNGGAETVSLLPYPSGAALADDPAFVSATHVYKFAPTNPPYPGQILYEFVKLEPTGLWDLGGSEDNVGVQSKINVYSPPNQIYSFPLTYGTSWHSFTVNQYVDGINDTESFDAIVDGFGTLITPPSSSNPALRLKEIHRSSQHFNEKYYTSYDWLTGNLYGAEINADQLGKPYNAMYSEPTGSGSVAHFLDVSGDDLSLSLSINPASDKETKLFFAMKDARDVQVLLMDELGRTVRELVNGRASTGQNVISIDPKTIAPGTYFIHVAADGVGSTRKLVITR